MSSPNATLPNATLPNATLPDVTIIIVPRERFQFAQESLESLYEHTDYPFKLVYIDNNSPAKLRKYLQTESEKRGFQLLHSERFLSPNQARNLGLSQVNSKYVVFLDNDIIFAPGWLQALVNCTEETGATVVGSLVCQYRPVHKIVHCAGGDYMSPEDYAKFIQGQPTVAPDVQGKWQINEKTYFQNRRVEEVCEHLKRQTTGFVEFHAMLVCTEIFAQIGVLDEGFSCTKEYLDFCMSVVRAGGTIYLEPDSIVTFLTHPPAPALQLADLSYFMVRWSDRWERNSLIHFQQKWDLVENKYFQKRLKKLGWRRREEIIHPIVERFGFLNQTSRKWLEERLVKLEKLLNRYISQQHERTVTGR